MLYTGRDRSEVRRLGLARARDGVRWEKLAMTIAGEQDVPLENKERVEVVKGIAGLESGVAAAGGLIDYVTKEPDPRLHPAIDMATDHRGTSYGALDVGRVFRGRFEPGIRLNLGGLLIGANRLLPLDD